MCFSTATLFYGLWVTTASLNFAATAHKASRPTILAIDLISSRRRRGKLVIEGQDEKTTASELPEEVWEMVKDEMVGFAIRKAELDTLDSLRCTFCKARDAGVAGCSCAACNLTPEQREQLVDGHPWSRWGDPSCPFEEYGCLWIVAASDITQSRNVEELASITKLLSHHGIALETAEMWHEDPKCAEEDLEALSAIALPLRSPQGRKKTIPRVDTSNSHSGGIEQSPSAVVELSPHALVLPSSADHRFARLVSKYRLHVVDRTKGTIIPVTQLEEPSAAPIQPATTGAKSKVEKGSAKEGDPGSSLFAVGEPRWMLWERCDTC